MNSFKEKLSEANYYIKRENELELCSNEELDIFLSLLNQLYQSEQNKNIKLLLRGTKTRILKDKLISKLNSNDTLFDGLFLIGDKAKNFLEKSEDILHPIKNINSKGVEVAEWIFDKYALVKSKNVPSEYFKNKSNKLNFSSTIENDPELIDYYLFGLQTWDSNLLVNFVSTTSSSEVAFSNNNDLILLLWLPNEYSIHTISKLTLDNKKSKIIDNGLPILTNSCFEQEDEYSFKGFILPHFIAGVYIIEEKKFVINPALMDIKNDWIQTGLDINGDSFLDFIKKSTYQRFLILHDNQNFEENNVC